MFNSMPNSVSTTATAAAAAVASTAAAAAAAANTTSESGAGMGMGMGMGMTGSGSSSSSSTPSPSVPMAPLTPSTPDSFYILVSFDPECSGLVEQLSAVLQQEIEDKRHDTIPAINIDTIARVDPTLTHKSLLLDLYGSHTGVSSSRLFVLTLLKDNASEQYLEVKDWSRSLSIPSQVLTQILNLRDPSLLMRNVVKQILSTFSTSASGSVTSVSANANANANAVMGMGMGMGMGAPAISTGTLPLSMPLPPPHPHPQFSMAAFPASSNTPAIASF